MSSHVLISVNNQNMVTCSHTSLQKFAPETAASYLLASKSLSLKKSATWWHSGPENFPSSDPFYRSHHGIQQNISRTNCSVQCVPHCGFWWRLQEGSAFIEEVEEGWGRKWRGGVSGKICSSPQTFSGSTQMIVIFSQKLEVGYNTTRLQVFPTSLIHGLSTYSVWGLHYEENVLTAHKHISLYSGMIARELVFWT